MSDYSPQIERRFSSARNDFADAAGGLLDYLCDTTFNQPDVPLHDEDLFATDYLQQLEGYAEALHEPLVALDGSYQRLEDYARQWRRFQAALPLSEPEFEWFMSIPNLKSTDTIAELEQKIGYQVATIVAGGIHRVVSGRELLGRWVSWRRETGEFADQGTLDIARDSLAELVEIVVPGTPLLESYAALRR
ncbi:MAG TPA: hypothetical protein VK778_09585 [Solirubrobacteraceae bacterium]|nr:hypothetical protein [Solirubrobacteraceae bacterium]